MIIVVQGKPGAGKSLYAVSLIEKYTTKYKTYSNIAVQLKKKKQQKNFEYIPSQNLLARLPKIAAQSSKEGSVKVVIDEIQVFLNSRKWDSLSEEVQVFLQQHRKRGLDIVGILQSVKRADKVFRELIQEFYIVRKGFVISIFGDAFGLFTLTKYDEDCIDDTRTTKDYNRVSFFPKFLFYMPGTFKAYNTSQETELKVYCKKCREELREKQICEKCQVHF